MKQINWRALFDQYKFVLLVIGVGLLLILLPLGEKPEKTAMPNVGGEETFDLTAFEARMGSVLSEIDGAGTVQVMLTVKGTARQVFAQDNKQALRDNSNEVTESTVVVSKGSGNQEAVLIQSVYPQFQGAVVVCPGGSDPAVRLKLTEAVAALTGLGADKISVCQSN